MFAEWVKAFPHTCCARCPKTCFFPTLSLLNILCATNLTHDLSPITMQWHSDLSQSPGRHHFSPSSQPIPTPAPFNMSPSPIESMWMVSPWVVWCSSPSMPPKSNQPQNILKEKKGPGHPTATTMEPQPALSSNKVSGQKQAHHECRYAP